MIRKKGKDERVRKEGRKRRKGGREWAWLVVVVTAVVIVEMLKEVCGERYEWG